MKFIGVSSSEQARRGFLRVVLYGNVLDLGFLTSNPLETWPAKVERWRAAVDAGKAEVAAQTSPASVTPGRALIGARGVVDVHILGAESGDTVGALARRLDNLISNVGVDSVQLINNADSIARDANLGDAIEHADPLGIGKLTSLLGTGLTIVAIIAAIYATAQLVKAAKSK